MTQDLEQQQVAEGEARAALRLEDTWTRSVRARLSEGMADLEAAQVSSPTPPSPPSLPLSAKGRLRKVMQDLEEQQRVRGRASAEGRARAALRD